MKRLENKIAVVTGASTGIGRGSAMVLASEGAHVLALTSLMSWTIRCKKLMTQVDKQQLKVDISDDQQVQQFADEAKEI